MSLAAGTELPADYIGLAGVVVIFVVAPIVSAVVYLWIQTRTNKDQMTATNKQVAATVGKINEVHEQTVNDHLQKSNLRDDLDITRDATIATQATTEAIFQMMNDMRERQMAQGRELGGMRADMTGVRADMTGLRTDITGVNSRLSDEQKRSIEADEQLWRAILNRPADDPPSR